MKQAGKKKRACGQGVETNQGSSDSGPEEVFGLPCIEHGGTDAFRPGLGVCEADRYSREAERSGVYSVE